MNTASDSNLVFVYGTLLLGEGNHHILAQHGSKFVGTAICEGVSMCVTHGAFPYCTTAKDAAWSTNQADGEVYEVSPECFRSLDMLEGVPHHYTRVLRNILVGDTTRLVWVYVVTHIPLGARPIGNSWRAWKLKGNERFASV